MASSAIWDIDAFAQDSWKLRPNLTLEYGVRFGNWTNNEELNGQGRILHPSLYNSDARARSSIQAPSSSVNGVCYVYNGCAPAGVLPNRSRVRPAARQRRVGHRR